MVDASASGDNLPSLSLFKHGFLSCNVLLLIDKAGLGYFNFNQLFRKWVDNVAEVFK